MTISRFPPCSGLDGIEKISGWQWILLVINLILLIDWDRIIMGEMEMGRTVSTGGSFILFTQQCFRSDLRLAVHSTG